MGNKKQKLNLVIIGSVALNPNNISHIAALDDGCIIFMNNHSCLSRITTKCTVDEMLSQLNNPKNWI